MIVPTHRGAATIGALLDSLERQTASHELIVVDNASGDGTSEILAARGIEVISPDRNLGFGCAVNLAARRAQGDALVLVNDDCVCDPGFVGSLAGALDPARGVVMAAGVLREARHESVIDTAGLEVDRTLLIFDYLNGEPVEILDRGVADPIGPCGAAAAFDRTTFLDAGGFDEALFAYWEDVDLALRLRRAGALCRLAPGALGTHAHSATMGSGSRQKNELVGFGRGYLLRKWGVLSPGRLPGIVARDTVICAGQAVFDRNLAGVTGRIKGWRAATPTAAYPGPELAAGTSPSALTTLSRRARRRRRLRGTRGAGPRS